MQEIDIIEKLSILKDIQPNESWVVNSRTKILAEAPISYDLGHNVAEKSIFGINFNSIFANKLAVSVSAFIFIIFGGFSVVSVSNSSLPGELLYSVKMAKEGATLAMTPEDEKAKIEIQQIGKRLEELAKISQNHSDIKQEEKVGKLLEEIETKNMKVDERITKLVNNGKKEKSIQVAMIVSDQNEKYNEILEKSTENLTNSIKERVSEKTDKAIASGEKVNLSSILVIVENMSEGNKSVISDEEISSKLNDEINQMEIESGVLKKRIDLIGEYSNACEAGVDANEVNVLDNSDCVENQFLVEQTALLNGVNEEIEKAKQSLKDNNLLDVINIILKVQITVAEMKNSIDEDEKNRMQTTPDEQENVNSDDSVDVSNETQGEVKADADILIDTNVNIIDEETTELLREAIPVD
ncbi:MAG: hypothetical protein P1P85_04525 [Patescibacteria group bacterium]|nr:hypothetical protein [Patescibacteria group bacterium]